MNPFDFVNSVNHTKEDIMTEDNESDYNSFLVNRSLSYFRDSVLIANEMNRYHHADNKLQYQFLINILRKRKRFSKWHKQETSHVVDALKRIYNYSDEKARQVLPLLTDEQLEDIIRKVDTGGRK